MNKPTEEQIKEFWEWCGWHIRREASYSSFFGSNLITTYYVSPDGVSEESFPPIDLNNLFKYAWEVAVTYLMGHLTHDRISAIRYLFDKWLEQYIKDGLRDFESALFWALWELRAQETNP